MFFLNLSIYPFSFSVVLNSILVSFPFLLIFVTHIIIKNEVFKNRPIFLINLLNVEFLRNLIHMTLNRTILIKDLKTGNIVNDFHFDDEYVKELIEEIDGNLEVFEDSDGDEGKYYFKSISAGGISEKEMYLIKILSAQKFIGEYISIKISYPFTPAIFAGLLIAVFYGDIIMVFAKKHGSGDMMVRDNGGQVALEYLLIFAVSLILLIVFTMPMVQLAIADTMDVSDTLNAKSDMSKIAQAVEEVYGQGQGSKQTVRIVSSKI